MPTFPPWRLCYVTSWSRLHLDEDTANASAAAFGAEQAISFRLHMW